MRRGQGHDLAGPQGNDLTRRHGANIGAAQGYKVYGLQGGNLLRGQRDHIGTAQAQSLGAG